MCKYNGHRRGGELLDNAGVDLCLCVVACSRALVPSAAGKMWQRSSRSGHGGLFVVSASGMPWFLPPRPCQPACDRHEQVASATKLTLKFSPSKYTSSKCYIFSYTSYYIPPHEGPDRNTVTHRRTDLIFCAVTIFTPLVGCLLITCLLIIGQSREDTIYPLVPPRVLEVKST